VPSIDTLSARGVKVSANVAFYGFAQTLPGAAEVWARYLSVNSATSPISVNNNSCFGHFNETIDEHTLENGVHAADLVVIVSGSDTLQTSSGLQLDICGPKSLGVGSYCSLDQNDRPILGFINFCLPLLTVESDGNPLGVRDLREETFQAANVGDYTLAQRMDTLIVAVHELGHILAMDVYLFKFFRDAETGEPLTPRPFQSRSVLCVDGSSKEMFMPSPQVIKQGVTDRGIIFYEVTTPRVAAVARNHFDCQTLDGARLENQRVGSQCFGSHWDERLFWTELMGPRFNGEIDNLSPLTLAIMEDSGWYQVNYEGVSTSPFGQGRGCDFVYEDCIVEDEVPEWGKGTFCSSPIAFDENEMISDATMKSMRCDPSHVAFSLCDLFDRTTVPDGFVDLPNNPVTYFSNPNLVASVAETDFCPLSVRDVGVDCTSTGTYESFYNGESTGPNSRCVNAQYHESPDGVLFNRPACMPVRCDEESRKLIVGSEIMSRVCTFDGEVIELPLSEVEYDGTIVVQDTNTSRTEFIECPRLVTICPHFFCPASCSARGICNWGTVPAKCTCFDPRDTSDGCYGYDPNSGPPDANSSNLGDDSSAAAILSLGIASLVFPILLLQ
jgi:leishmanolysin-like peptidase